jgi:chemotaxis protein CheY-P-specific phosphatase CheC
MRAGLTSDEHDAFHEICNIAMGQASRALAQFLDHVIQLSVPEVCTLTVDGLDDLLSEVYGADDMTSLVRQSFYGRVSGEVIACHSRGPADDMALALGYHGARDTAAEREFILDLSSLLSGAVLNGIGEQLGIDMAFSAPTPIESLDQLRPRALGRELTWTRALVSNIEFRLEDRQFASRILVFWPEGCFDTIGTALGRYLAVL